MLSGKGCKIAIMTVNIITITKLEALYLDFHYCQQMVVTNQHNLHMTAVCMRGVTEVVAMCLP